MRFLQIKLNALLLALVMCAAGAQAAELTPDALVKTVTEDVLNIVRTDRAIQAGDMKRVSEVIDAKVLPHFNFTRMTALAMSREWRNATPEQQATLTAEFRTLLVRSYAGALTTYREQQISFKPLRMQPTDTDVMVRTEVRQPGSSPVPIDYSLGKDGEVWKVYDVVVAGVSLVTNYRETFSREIRASGIDGLIKVLQEKNAKTGQGAK
jgi:phospholipid transport system substrate-binding protein